MGEGGGLPSDHIAWIVALLLGFVLAWVPGMEVDGAAVLSSLHGDKASLGRQQGVPVTSDPRHPGSFLSFAPICLHPIVLVNWGRRRRGGDDT